MRIVGRDTEVNWLAGLLAESATQSRVVTLEAPAGAGKSALLSAAIDAAAQAGVRVLRCQPNEVESHYPYAALGDLLSSVASFDELDPAPRRALESALLRSTDPLSGNDAGSFDVRAVGLGCAAVWRRLADEGPLIIVIDDVHWLDAASADALAFSIRRVPTAGVLVVGARREDEPGPTLPGDVVSLAPLSEPTVMMLLSERAGEGPRRLAGRELRRIIDAAGGNPLFAIELARHAARSAPTTDGYLSVPTSLEAVIGERFHRLAPSVLEALTAMAMLARPDLAAVAALGLADAITEAEREGILHTGDGRVTFSHPLFATAALHRATPTVRRALHSRLATATTDPYEQLRHAAHASEQRNDSLASRLAQHASDLSDRGAREQAADFAVLAAKLSPLDDPARHDRGVEAARLSFQRGEADLALQMLADLEGTSPSPGGRVRELLVRAAVEFSSGSSLIAQRHCVEALDECTTDTERVEVHSILSRVAYDNFDECTRHATIAMELAQHCDVPNSVLSGVFVARAGGAFSAGHGLDRELFERAIELESDSNTYSPDSAYSSFAVLLKIADEMDESRSMLLTVLHDNEDEGALPFALSHLPQLELWTGNWDAAEDYGQRHLDAALRTGQHDQATQARNNLALIDVHRGDVAGAAVLAEAVRTAGREIGDVWTERNGLGLLGMVALAEGDARRAVELLRRWHELAEQMALRDPGYCRQQGDFVEALVATGALDEAAEYAAFMAANAERLDRPTLRAGASRALALVAAAQGDRDRAVGLAEEAVARYAATPLVVEHARSMLTLGQIHRRFKEKAAARVQLEAALAVFDRLGAERWAERTRQDLARIGLRTTHATALTETERRVARLAATGRTVRQVGDELFISPKTVEANLTRVYRKLGLSGRAELATWAATVDDRTA